MPLTMASKNNSEESGQSSHGAHTINLVRNSVVNFVLAKIKHYGRLVSRLRGAT